MSNECYSQGLMFKLIPSMKPIFQGLIQVFFFRSLWSLFISPESFLTNNNWLRQETKKLTLLLCSTDCSSVINHISNIRMKEKSYAHIHTHILYVCELLLLPLTGTKCFVHAKQINCILNEWIHWQSDGNANMTEECT